MLIGIDIDDVLYETSKMIHEQLPAILQQEGLHVNINKEGYYLDDICGIYDMSIINRLNAKLDWCSPEYINESAIAALKALPEKNDNIEYCIVTWREESSAAEISKIISEKYGLHLNKRFCLPLGQSKARCCSENNIDILLDDSAIVIASFTHTNANCEAILVSPDFVWHNKKYANEYERVDLVLRKWSDLAAIYERINGRKETYINE